MAGKNNKEEDRKHLRLVGKDEPLEEGTGEEDTGKAGVGEADADKAGVGEAGVGEAGAGEAGAGNEGSNVKDVSVKGADIEAIGELYTKIAIALTNMYIDEWDEYTADGMGRDEFLRTVIEIDEAEMVHPVIAFDSSPAPTAKKPEETPEKYGILDLTKTSAEEEDSLLWNFEAKGANYKVAFIPMRAVKELEEGVHGLVESIVKDNNKQKDPDTEADPIFEIGYVREITILFNNLYNEYSVYNDDGYFDDFDEDDEDEDKGAMDNWPTEIRQEFEEEVSELFKGLQLGRLSISKYIIVARQ